MNFVIDIFKRPFGFACRQGKHDVLVAFENWALWLNQAKNCLNMEYLFKPEIYSWRFNWCFCRLCFMGFYNPYMDHTGCPDIFYKSSRSSRTRMPINIKNSELWKKNCTFDFWDLLNYFWGQLWNIIKIEITVSNDDIRFISGRNPLINPLFSRIIATFGAPIFGYHNIYTFDPSFALCQFEKLAWSLIHQLLKKWCR